MYATLSHALLVYDSYGFQVPMVMSTASMKVQTTVFVGNISEKASDTLVRQILLVSLKI